jgi:hypothetical protein
MKILLIGLRKLGFTGEADKIENQWNKMPFISNIEPVNEYQYAYPDDLLTEIAEIILRGMTDSGFSIITPASMPLLKQNSIIKLLNDAWSQFGSTQFHSDNGRNFNQEAKSSDIESRNHLIALTSSFSKWAYQNMSDKRLIGYYEGSLKDEPHHRRCELH